MTNRKSRYARFWLTGGIVVQILLLAIGAFRNFDFGEPGYWTVRWATAAVSLVLLLVAAWLMHAGDYNRKTRSGSGYGVRYAYHRLGADYRTDDAVISGVLGRESIQVAITVGLLGALLEKGERPRPQQLVDLWRDPAWLMYSVIAAVLGLSIITTLASILCYDYTTRFSWPREMAKSLVRKGHNFGVWGFYSLMWSLPTITSLLSYWLCMATVLAVFVVMWGYYFLPQERISALEAAQASRGKAAPMEGAAEAAKAAGDKAAEAKGASEAAKAAADKADELKASAEAAKRAADKAADAERAAEAARKAGGTDRARSS